MARNHNQDDEQPLTTAAAARDETEIGAAADETELVPPIAARASELAWSDEDGAAGGDYSWGGAAERASIIVIAGAAVAVAVGLLTWLGFHLLDQPKPTVAPEATRPATIVPEALPTVTAAPPSTVTVIPPAPAPTTVTVQALPPPAPTVKPAPALPPPGGTHVFSICPDGHEGVVGGHTSCAFAANVRQVFYASGMAGSFTAFSPVTGDGYEMTCVGRYPAYFSDGSTKVSTRCYGGDNAEVVIW
ncbi:hypothetical protein MMAN_00360 [Mycobacterium mantenii]|uniref:Uncharacterized protein n=1 Tax=Mycobacterium mantenii TaxID=560555 RepID=A0A1X0G3V1_MYCNT|nr:hypothetical protein [Mycobacterium mantenii]MCV7243839.1 hypothetical protein [Mycobacterium mantenii]ORB08711.1 hypothetical protein BST30_01865 [Mycobacterium mantenii]BBY35902.1 hypothetical protein MMAN_00360 [Mycobacterium mantenii]